MLKLCKIAVILITLEALIHSVTYLVYTTVINLRRITERVANQTVDQDIIISRKLDLLLLSQLTYKPRSSSRQLLSPELWRLCMEIWVHRLIKWKAPIINFLAHIATVITSHSTHLITLTERTSETKKYRIECLVLRKIAARSSILDLDLVLIIARRLDMIQVKIIIVIIIVTWGNLELLIIQLLFKMEQSEG